MKDEDLRAFAPEHIFNKDKNVIIIKQDKPDSLEIREDSRGNIHPTLKIYFNSDNPDELKRISELWLKIQKEVLKR